MGKAISVLLILFLGTTTLLWLSVFGYLLALASRLRPNKRSSLLSSCPASGITTR